MPPSHFAVGSPPYGVLQTISTSRLRDLLQDYPDRDLVTRLLDGFENGFLIGVEGEVGPGCSKNNFSALLRKGAVTSALDREVLAGTIHGPFSKPPFPRFHCSPVTAVDKPDGSVRLILDMSSPRGDALNERIDKDKFACRYSSFDNAVDLVRQAGRGSFLAKLDVKNAFRLCPVRPSDWYLLGFKWLKLFYYYVALPFGSRSSPAIFNEFADVLCWLFRCKGGITWVDHYLDDYFFVDRLESSCQTVLDAAQGLCAFLQVPLAKEKIVGPAQVVTYLGIEIDTVDFSLRLPSTKMDKLGCLLTQWRSGATSCTKRDLLSLIGTLSFACKVIKPGRTFLRRLIDLSTTVHNLNSEVALDAEARLDIRWWQRFLPLWNGRETIQAPIVTAASWGLYTDASSLGMGGGFL